MEDLELDSEGYVDEALDLGAEEVAEEVAETVEDTTLYYADGSPVEYDENGEPIYDDEPQETAPVAHAAPQAVSATPVVPVYNPALAPILTEAEQERLAELGLTAPIVAAIADIAGRIASKREQVSSVADTYYQQEAAKAPALFQAIGPKVRQNLAGLQPEFRSTEKGVRIAISMAMLEEAEQTGDFAGTLARYGAMAKGGAPVTRRPAAPVVQARQKAPVASPNAAPRVSVATRQRPKVQQIGVGLNLTAAEMALLAEDPLIAG